jgi:hypothetical protein
MTQAGDDDRPGQRNDNNYLIVPSTPIAYSVIFIQRSHREEKALARTRNNKSFNKYLDFEEEGANSSVLSQKTTKES